MNKQELLDELERHKKAITELEDKLSKPEVKPMFPFEGDFFIVTHLGNIESKYGFYGNNYKALALQGRTFYTREEAEAFTKLERARAYYLERINEVNEGDNGFKKNGDNYIIEYDHESNITVYSWISPLQGNEACEYIRTREAAEQLINNPEFVEQFKIWKGVE